MHTLLKAKKGRTNPGYIVCSASILFMMLTANLTYADGQLSFTRDVMPVLQKAGCSAGKCHGSFKGRGGLRFSLFASDPEMDYEALVKNDLGRRVQAVAPGQSLCLLKPTGQVKHGGGKLFDVDSPAYRILHTWMSQGMPGPSNDDPTLTQLQVEPSDIVLSPGQQRKLTVRAHWSDGQVRTVEPWSIYKARIDQIADVDKQGIVHAKKPGRTAVTIQYMGRVTAVTVSVPYADSKVVAQSEAFRSFRPNNYIDELILAEWKKMGLKPAPLADDHEFIRRVYLDVIGTLPTPKEIEQFVNSKDSNKRSQLIDDLLNRSEYGDYWTMKWGDLLRVNSRFLGEKGMWSFYGWLRKSIRDNKPIDQFTRELLTSRGNLYANGAVAYYFVDDGPEMLAETTAQVFLGVRMQCARCHHHPMEVWSQQDYYGLANFFTRIEKRDNGDAGRFGGAKLIRVVDHYNKAGMRVKQVVAPQAFGKAKVDEPGGDVRKTLARWVTDKDNPFFARNWANRYWAYMMGRGLIEPIDDLRGTNPPSMPKLLDALSEDLRKHDYDVKHLIRRICNSRVYQLKSRVASKQDREGMFYSYRKYRRLPAQVLLDAIAQATDMPVQYTGMPVGTRTIALPQPDLRNQFLRTFGQSTRANPCECASTTNSDLAQALTMINDAVIEQRVSNSRSRLHQLLKSKRTDEQIIHELYLWSISRPPTDAEMDRIQQQLKMAPSRTDGFQDLQWALLNSTRFVFSH